MRPGAACGPIHVSQTSDPIYGCSTNPIALIVRRHRTNHPVFFIEVRPPFHLDHLSYRERADTQVRERFYSLWSPDVHDQVPVLYGISTPVLCGLSALGTTFAVYTLDYDRVAPRRSDEEIVDIAPRDRWGHDFFTDGDWVLGGIAASVKSASL